MYLSVVSPKTPQFSKNGKLRHKSVKAKEHNSQTGQNLDPKNAIFCGPTKSGIICAKRRWNQKSEHGSLDRNLANSLTLEALHF